MLQNALLAGAGGFVGTVLRWLVGLLPLKTAHGFPVKTLLINVSGAFLLGLIAAWAARRAPDPRLVLLLKVGLCGGFTTFSTFAYETSELFARGQTALALLYAVSSAVLGVLAVFAAGALLR